MKERFSRMIKSPEELYQFFEDYKKDKPNRAKKKEIYNPKLDEFREISLEVPLTWVGFEGYLSRKGIGSHIKDYRFNRDNRYDRYVSIINKIGDEIQAEMVEGASSGVYKENIIARLLGLADKKETKVDGNLTIDFTEEDD